MSHAHPNPADQGSLFQFEDEVPPLVSATSAVTLQANTSRPLSRWQREFNTLSTEVQQLREVLGDAQQLLDQYRSHVAKVYEPRWRELQTARREWAVAADAVLQRQASWPKAQRLSRKRQKHLSEFLVAFVDDLLFEDDNDAELTAIHDRYSDLSWEASQELDQELTQAFMEEIVGKEAMQGHDATDVEGILRHAREQLEAQQQAEAERRERRAQSKGKGPGPSKADLKREQAAKDVSQTVREVYRKLASSLHPDRESDPAEQARKTKLMQEANKAYEQGDLLQLLSMQINLIRSDQNALTLADDARLKLYCQSLREQQQILKIEIAETEDPIRHAMGLGPRGRMPERPAVLAKVDSDTNHLKRAISGVREDIQVLADPRSCARVIDQLELPDDDLDTFDSLGDIVLRSAVVPSRKRRR